MKLYFTIIFLFLIIFCQAQSKISYLDENFKDTRKKKAVYQKEQTEENDTIYKKIKKNGVTVF
ncbi:MAG: hypothetical protein ACKVQB_13035, partial [Bacteroidia bacterium]